MNNEIKVIDTSIMMNNLYIFNFFKTKNYLDYEDNFKKFIKSVERLVRGLPDYKAFKENLHEMGLDRCMILSNITTNNGGGNRILDMHHGPYLTLYDICAIITDHKLNKGEKVTEFDIAYEVIQEHYNGNVQVIMLSETIHDLVHDGKIFINPRQSIGNISEFLRKYPLGVNDEYKKILASNAQVFNEMNQYNAEILVLDGQMQNYMNLFKWKEI